MPRDWVSANHELVDELESTGLGRRAWVDELGSTSLELHAARLGLSDPRTGRRAWVDGLGSRSLGRGAWSFMPRVEGLGDPRASLEKLYGTLQPSCLGNKNKLKSIKSQ